MGKGTFFTVITLLILALMMAQPGAAQARVVKEAEIRRVISDYVQEKTAGLGLEVNIKKIGYSGDLRLPEGEPAYEVSAPRNWEGWGRANLALIVRVNDRIEKNIPISVEVAALGDMVVSTRQLERGEVIGDADVAIQKRDLAQIAGRVARSLDEVLGKRVKSSIRGNNPVRGDQLERLPVVTSGQLVTIIAENQTLRLTAPGKARSNGAEGDRVMVQNLNSLKELSGRVIDANTVMVDF